MDTDSLLDPELATLVSGFMLDDLDDTMVSAFRDVPPAPPLESETVESIDHTVDGEPAIIVRVHRARGAAGALPCVYSIHGGGYVVGSRDMDDVRLQGMCVALGVVGVSVEYRLAPETTYPDPLEDCYRGLRWTHEHAAELGVDPDRIAIRGTSAGGGLAAALAILARDRGELAVRCQLLEAPMIDDRQQSASSRRGDLAVWSNGSNSFGWRSYLGDLYGADDVPDTAAPARAEDLSGLPPAMIVVGAQDGFLDEDVDYALRLGRAGVAVDLRVHAGACHGYQMFTDLPLTVRANREIDEWLGRQLAP